MDEETLGQYIRRMRKAQGLTQEELARAVGITKAYICIIERGDLTGRGVSVSPAKLDAIAHALNVRAEEIFNRARILPHGTTLVRDDAPLGGEELQTASPSLTRDIESIRDWDELCAAGYSDLPPNVRDEIKSYIEFRARQLRESHTSNSSR
jgi:transcriptional regulator with XRE-family HTH domain